MLKLTARLIICDLIFMHPDALDYLLGLVTEVANYDIDGLIFAADYTQSPIDGLSSLNQILFNHETGREFDFDQLDVSLLNENFDNIAEQSLSPEFEHFSRWKTNKIHLTLLQLIRHVRALLPVVKLGVEVLPELINEPKIAYYKHSIAYQQVLSLPADFFVLYRSQYDDRTLFEAAARKFPALVAEDTKLLLQVGSNIASEEPISLINQQISDIKTLNQIQGKNQLLFSPPNHSWNLILD